jgi:hypothetical protein
MATSTKGGDLCLFIVTFTGDDFVCGLSLQCVAMGMVCLILCIYISQLDKIPQRDERGEGRQRHLIMFYLFLDKYEL